MSKPTTDICGDLQDVKKTAKITFSGTIPRNPEMFFITLENRGSAKRSIIKIQVNFQTKDAQNCVVLSTDYASVKPFTVGDYFPFLNGRFELIITFKTNEFVIAVGNRFLANYHLYTQYENINHYHVQGDVEHVVYSVYN